VTARTRSAFAPLKSQRSNYIGNQRNNSAPKRGLESARRGFLRSLCSLSAGEADLITPKFGSVASRPTSDGDVSVFFGSDGQTCRETAGKRSDIDSWDLIQFVPEP
jgi:hypothetical protein